MGNVYEDLSKEQLLVEFRAVRNACDKLHSQKNDLIKVIVNKLGTEQHVILGISNSDATIFELLLS
jgi:hypothetical protein